MASNASGIRAGKAYVEMGGNDGPLTAALRSAEAKVKAFGRSVGEVGRGLIKFGSGAGLAFAGSAKVFSDYESQMARVKALTNANEGDFAKLGNKAKQLGRDTVFSAAQAAEAMGVFALAGFKVDQILSAVGPTLDLAAAGQIGIAQSADIAAKIMSGMGIAAGDLGGAVDVMAKAMTTANTDILMLGDAFKFVGPVAKVAGVSFAEVTAAIQLLSNAGIQGEMAGTTLRGMILSLTAPSEKATEILTALGVSARDSRGNFRSLTDIIGQLQRSLAGMGSADRLSMLGQIFPDRQAAGAAELVAQGAERLAAATRELGAAGGTAARIAGTQLDTLFGTFKLIMSSLEGIGIEVGTALAPSLRKAGAAMVDVLNTIATLAKNNQGLVLGLAKVTAATLGVGAAMVAASAAIKVVAFSLGAVATVSRVAFAAFTAIRAAVLAVNAAFGFLTVSIKLASAATTVFSAVSAAATGVMAGLSAVVSALLTPLGLVALALAGLAGWIAYTGKSGAILGWLGKQFESLKTTALAAIGGITDALRAGDLELASKILWAGLNVVWVKGVVALKEIWATLTSGMHAAVVEMRSRIASVLVDMWAGWRIGFVQAIAFVQNAFTSFLAFIEKQLNNILGFYRKVWAIMKAVVTGKGPAAAEGEARAITAETEDRNAKIDRRTNMKNRLRSREADRDSAKIDADREAKQRILMEDKAAEVARIRAAADAGVAGSREELAKAEAELARLREEARIKASRVTGIIEPSGDSGVGAGPGPADMSPESLADGIAAAAAKVDVAGSFSAANLAGIGAGESVQNDQLKEQKKATDQLEKLNRKADLSRLVFARD